MLALVRRRRRIPSLPSSSVANVLIKDSCRMFLVFLLEHFAMEHFDVLHKSHETHIVLYGT